MLNEVQLCGIIHRIAKQAVDHFPEYFTRSNRKAASEKANNCYGTADEYLASLPSPENTTLALTSS